METGLVPHWIDVAATVYITICAVCCLYIVVDQRRRPAPMMKIMVWVWPINALWAGPLGVLAYCTLGIRHSGSQSESMHHSDKTAPTAPMKSMPGMDMSSMDMSSMNMSSMHTHSFTWKNVVTGTLHCGSGCTLADLLGPWLFTVVPFTLWNSTTYGEWALDYVLALMIGVFFQYAGLASMSKERGLPLWWRAFKVDVLSLTAWQVGMYGWMGLSIFALFGPLSPSTPSYWLMMQISMACGFITAFPMNWILIRTGVKSAM